MPDDTIEERIKQIEKAQAQDYAGIPGEIRQQCLMKAQLDAIKKLLQR